MCSNNLLNIQTDDIGRYELGSLIAPSPLYLGKTYIFLKLSGYSPVLKIVLKSRDKGSNKENKVFFRTRDGILSPIQDLDFSLEKASDTSFGVMAMSFCWTIANSFRKQSLFSGVSGSGRIKAEERISAFSSIVSKSLLSLTRVGTWC
jgi:hypothetical protein